MRRRNIAILIFLCSCLFSYGQLPEKPIRQIPEFFCISSMEMKLYNMINSYRQRYDLPPIPLSKSLCFVASTHVKDLYFHHPDKGKCNAHSWSDQGNWKAFCYPHDENKVNSVWDKPKELTPYRAKGIEIVYYENDAVVIDSIITFWKSMDYFNSFLMNTGTWQNKKWNAIGIGIHENYACAWFGEQPDPQGEPNICGQEQVIPVSRSNIEEKKILPKTENIETRTDTETKTKPEIKLKTKSETQLPTQERYYIIVKGVAPEKELLQCLKELQAKGYSSSRIFEYNGKRRVSIMEFSDKAKTDSALRQIRKTWTDAWVLKPESKE